MSLLRVAIGTIGFLVSTSAPADEAPRKPVPSPQTFVCRDLPRLESRVKDHVCGSPQQVARNKSDREQLATLSQAAAANSFPPLGAGMTTTTPMQ
jgi:hypothetical protein